MIWSVAWTTAPGTLPRGVVRKSAKARGAAMPWDSPAFWERGNVLVMMSAMELTSATQPDALQESPTVVGKAPQEACLGTTKNTKFVRVSLKQKYK